jgi:NitT/TauT family transport system substrate-binding protein
MLAEGKVAAVTGFSFSATLNLKRLGVPADDLSSS